MSTRAATERFPRVPLLAAAALVLLALVAVVLTRVTGIGASRTAEAEVVALKQLRFEDRSDGGVAVYDVQAQELVDVITGPQGFLRGTLRGFARERKRQAIDMRLALHLIARADGHLTLEDPHTGRKVDLGVFGPTNARAFAQLLLLRSPAPLSVATPHTRMRSNR
jgi:putative photosynthetic complex assembly protein